MVKLEMKCGMLEKNLKNKSVSSRNIWSIGPNYPSGINNFVTSNLSYLKGDLYYGASPDSDANAKKLINFVRGVDSYDEDADGKTDDARWNLGIYIILKLQ